MIGSHWERDYPPHHHQHQAEALSLSPLAKQNNFISISTKIIRYVLSKLYVGDGDGVGVSDGDGVCLSAPAWQPWQHHLLRWWPVMSAGSRVLVLAIPATVLTHSSPAMLAVYDPHTAQAGAITTKLFIVFFFFLLWPDLVLHGMFWRNRETGLEDL